MHKYKVQSTKCKVQSAEDKVQSGRGDSGEKVRKPHRIGLNIEKIIEILVYNTQLLRAFVPNFPAIEILSRKITSILVLVLAIVCF